jgi:hypothetical protein
MCLRKQLNFGANRHSAPVQANITTNPFASFQQLIAYGVGGASGMPQRQKTGYRVGLTVKVSRIQLCHSRMFYD